MGEEEEEKTLDQQVEQSLEIVDDIAHNFSECQELLRSDLVALVGDHGSVDTTRLPDGMKGHLRAKLAYNAPELEGVPGVKTTITDTGASCWCTTDKSNILNHQELTKKVKLDGIAGALSVVGQGIKRGGMVTLDRKIKVKECEVHHVPGLPVDLVPPLTVMKTASKGQFEINGANM